MRGSDDARQVEWSKLDVARSADVEASAVSCAVWALSSEGRAEVLEPSSAEETALKGRRELAGGLLMSCIETVKLREQQLNSLVRKFLLSAPKLRLLAISSRTGRLLSVVKSRGT